MKRKIFLFSIAIACILLPVHSIIKAEETSLKVSTLLSNPLQYNGKKISFSGEVIGEPLGRDDFRWINLLDKDGNAIGIWLKKEFLKEIKYYGKYKFKGDIVEVDGIYHSTCNEHGGDTDIHAYSLNIIERGFEVKERINIKRIYFILLLGTTILVILVISRIKKHYES